jgi:hypothetical protein
LLKKLSTIWSVAYDGAKREKKKIIISPTTLNTPKRKKERKIKTFLFLKKYNFIEKS